MTSLIIDFLWLVFYGAIIIYLIKIMKNKK